jgi:hypothetical protein
MKTWLNVWSQSLPKVDKFREMIVLGWAQKRLVGFLKARDEDQGSLLTPTEIVSTVVALGSTTRLKAAHGMTGSLGNGRAKEHLIEVQDHGAVKMHHLIEGPLLNVEMRFHLS